MKTWLQNYLMILSFILKGFLYLGVALIPIVVLFLPQPYNAILCVICTVAVLPILIMGPDRFIGSI